MGLVRNEVDCIQRLLRRMQWPLIVALMVVATPALAQRCGSGCGNAEALLGLSERALVAMYPELRRSKSVVSGPGNLRGRWSLADVTLGSQSFDAVIYVESGLVGRVEFVSTAGQSACRNRAVFSSTKEELVARYGESQAAATYDVNGHAMQTLSFSSETTDVMLHVTETQDACDTRVVFKPHVEKDASSL